MTQTRDRLGQFLAMNYGLAMAAAELSWLDDTLSELSRQQPPQEDEQGNSATSAIPVVARSMASPRF